MWVWCGVVWCGVVQCRQRFGTWWRQNLKVRSTEGKECSRASPQQPPQVGWLSPPRLLAWPLYAPRPRYLVITPQKGPVELEQPLPLPLPERHITVTLPLQVGPVELEQPAALSAPALALSHGSLQPYFGSEACG